VVDHFAGRLLFVQTGGAEDVHPSIWWERPPSGSLFT
jgi:hypothetical protein